MEFTDRIKELIKNNNISVNQMAKDLGFGTGTFNTWEENSRFPRGDIVLKIAQYFHVSTDYLLTGTEYTSIQLPEDEIRLLEYYNKLSDFDKGELIGELKTKAENDESKRDA